MNSENIWMKFTVVFIILFLCGSSYMLYQFLYDEHNELLKGRFIPIPELDVESYDKLIKVRESETTSE